MPVRDLLSAASGAGGATDPYFYDVTLLLNGDGTNGAQNNTFLDSSSNAFTITRNGNTTQGSFSPYGNLWSNYFDGSSAYLSVASNSNLAASGDFTIECWVFPTSALGSSYQTVYTVDPTNGLYFGGSTSGFGIRAKNNTDILMVTAPATNQWTHVAASRQSGTLRIFYNGIQQGSTSDSTNFVSGQAYIGNDASGHLFPGYISNLRFNNSTALYTANFTPSTSALTSVSGTQLLTCQSNRFIDNSANSITISVAGGSPSVQRFSPFNPTAPYSTTTIGGSGYFPDGSSSNLTTPNVSAFQFGTGDFTIEMWIYMTTFSVGTQRFLFETGNNSTGEASLRINTSGKVEFFADNSAPFVFSGATTLSANTWYHIAVTRSGSTNRIFLNGIQDASATNSYSYSGAGSNVQIGYWTADTPGLIGYMTDLRVLKGTAVYTSNFSVPTAPLTAITNTSLLLNYTNAGIPDLAMQNDLQTVGSAQVSTSVKKYGTGSLNFNGSTDYLVAPNLPNLNFGLGDFTIEGWVYFNSVSSAQMIVTSNYNAGTGGGGWAFIYRGDISSLSLSVNSNVTYTKSWSPSVSTWYYVTVCRSGTNLRLFVNGTQIGTTSTSTDNITGATTLVVANNLAGAPNLYLNGYLDDLRITNGYARYTSNFTAPTSALPTY
jgi:hypothetical protein